MKTPTTPTDEILATPTLTKASPTTKAVAPAPEAWEEFLEDDASCCGGCHHKPR